MILGFWALMSATGAVRGDEERGLTERWLAAGVSRYQLIAFRLAAVAVAGAAALALTGAGTDLGAVLGGSPLPWARLIQQSAALLVLFLCCFGIALLAAQFISNRRSAAGVAGAILLALFLLNRLSNTTEALKPWRLISPFYWSDRTDAIAPGGSFDLPATLSLLVAAVVLTAGAVMAFGRRDLGGTLIAGRPRASRRALAPAPNPLLRIPVLAAIYEQRIGLSFWLLGVMLLAALLTPIINSSVDLIVSNPGFAPYVAQLGHRNLYQAFFGFSWFGLLELFIAVYAVTQVGRWSNDDTEGRLEMVLSAPVPRARVAIERMISLAVSCSAIILAGALVASLVATSQGVNLNAMDVFIAALLLLPFGLAFGALGSAIAGWLPRAAVPTLSAFAVASYFIQQLGLLFRWPQAIINLSLFNLYGAPLVSGVYWTGLWVLLGICLAGFTLAVVGLQRRDVGR